MKQALQIILVFALAGLAFSGTLTYREVFASAAKCPSPGAPGTILGYPACVYGFFMYLAITIVAIAGLRAGSRPRLPPAVTEIGASAQPR
jgi:uncharacterized membrane protein